MSSFLAHLIARASRQAPVLARRQPTLFEPATVWTPPQTTAWPQPPATQAPLEMPSIVGPTRQEPRPLHDRNATQDAVASHSALAEIAPRTSAGMPIPDNVAPRNVVRMAPAAAPTAAVRTVVAHDVRHAPPPTEPKPAGDATATAPTVVPRRRPAPLADETSRPRKAVPLGQDVLPRPATKAAEAARQRHDPPTGVLVPARPQNARAVQLAKAAPSRAAMTSSTATQAAQESVQITIGRVEVRAVTASERPAARVAKQAVPRLTLDDYLRQRSGGGR